MEEKINKELQAESAERLLKLIRMGHPNEKGEPYSRFEVMKEINKRPNILKDLGWTTEDDAIYLNLYTHSSKTLKDISYNIHDGLNLWGVMEHWCPEAIWTDEFCFDEYNPNSKNKLTGW